MNFHIGLKQFRTAWVIVFALAAAASWSVAQTTTTVNNSKGNAVIYTLIDGTSSPTFAEGASSWAYYDATNFHPTQYCLGYREVAFKASDQTTKFSSPSTYDFVKSTTTPLNNNALVDALVKKDLPIVIDANGIVYIQDGHHTMAGLLAAHDANSAIPTFGYGHIVANFELTKYGADLATRQAAFTTFINSYGNSYYYGPNGNGLTGNPGPMVSSVSQLPSVVWSSAQGSSPMVDDPYRSLTWGMKYKSGDVATKGVGGYDDKSVNFLEFYWADLFRDRIKWDNKNNSITGTDEQPFLIAVSNGNVLAHSESMRAQFAAALNSQGHGATPEDYGFVAANLTNTPTRLTISNDSWLEGDINPSATTATTNSLNAIAKDGTTVKIDGKISNINVLNINAAHNTVTITGGDKAGRTFDVAGGTGTVQINNTANDYTGTTHVYGGTLGGSGKIVGDVVNHGATINGDATNKLTLAGTVSGTGEFDNINFTGTFSPGFSPAVVNVSNDTLADNAHLLMEIAGINTGQYDQLNITGDLQLGGTLEIKFIDGFMPVNDLAFTLFHGHTTGQFKNIILPDLPSGLHFDSSSLYSGGALTVVPLPAAAPMGIGLLLILATVRIFRKRTA